MERPASRGALAAGGLQRPPTGQQVERPERPSTAQRTQAAAGPGTPQQRAALPSTASSFLGQPSSTAYKRVLASGAAEAAQAVARPMTQAAGLGGGLRTAGGGTAGRQVLDRAYFINELRQKQQHIINATAQMRDELEVLEQKKAAAGRAEKVAGQLRKEVRLLQEALADSNIVIDKAGSQTPLQAIHAEYAAIRGRNEAQQARVEDMLSQRLALEQSTKQAEAQLTAIQAALDRRLNSMAPSARAAYQELLAEQAALLAEGGRFEEEAAQLGAALATAEGELGRNSLKQRALELQEQLRVLAQRKLELAAAEEAARASPEEQREALLARIKRDNAAVEQHTADAKQLQARVRELEARVAAANQGAARQEAAAAGEDEQTRRAKFEELISKARELNAFLDAFPQRRAAKRAELTAKQAAIARLLDHLAAQTDAAASGGPASPQPARVSLSVAAAAAVSGGAAAPGGAGSGSEAAGGAGGPRGIAARQSELDKLVGLESKIGTELEGLRERMAAMRAQLDRFGGVEAARTAQQGAQDMLAGEQRRLRAQADALKAELADQAWALQTKEAQLKQTPAWPAIERLGEQLRQVKAQADEARGALAAHEAAARASSQALAEALAAADALNAATVAAAVGG